MSMPPPPPGNTPPPPPGNMPPPPTGGAPFGGGAPASSAGLASWGERVVAYLIDWVIIVVPVIALYIVGAILGAVADVLGVLVFLVAWLVSVVAGFYLMYLNGSVGQTPGKKVMGLKVVSETTGQVIGGGAGIGRGFCHLIDALICYIGFLFPLWDAKRQTIADKILKTVVTSGNPKVDFMTAVKSVIPSK